MRAVAGTPRILVATLLGSSMLAANAVRLAAQELPPMAFDLVRRIREEGLERSQIQDLAWHLTDAVGPRLTGSDALKSAESWAAEKLGGWGLDEVTVEPWGTFGRGWVAESMSAAMVLPYYKPLHARPLAWTTGTGATLRAPVVLVPGGTKDLAGLVTPSSAALDSLTPRLRGAVVLLAPASDGAVDSLPPEFRWTNDEILPSHPRRATTYDPDAAAAQLTLLDSIVGDIRTRHARRDTLLRAKGVAAVLTPSLLSDGILSGLGDWAGIDPTLPTPLPDFVVTREQYAEIHRMLRRGVEVTLELSARNRFLSSREGANVFADLRGCERPDQYVMIGAHLDSWHLATGATDNAAGAAVMMEAMRILRTLDARPRRSIRMALWSGEEEGLLGSTRWLAAHPELHDRITYYLNLDSGTGRIRAVRDQGRSELIPVLDDILWPLKDLGVLGGVHGRSGGSDNMGFEALGIPGLTFLQDPIEYENRTHHSELDGYDHLVLGDLEQAAVVVAVIAYHLANAPDSE